MTKSPLPRTRTPESLRSTRWFGPADLRSFGHRSRAMQMGWSEEDWAGKPVIGILNTWSDIHPCHTHFRQRVEDVKQRHAAGRRPADRAAGAALPENFVSRPPCSTATCWPWRRRRSSARQPVDGAVLMGGCDKTGPGLLLGAISADVPTIFLPAGPMLRGNWNGKVLGSGSDSWKYWDELRAGKITDEDWLGVEGGIARSTAPA